MSLSGGALLSNNNSAPVTRRYGYPMKSHSEQLSRDSSSFDNNGVAGSGGGGGGGSTLRSSTLLRDGGRVSPLETKAKTCCFCWCCCCSCSCLRPKPTPEEPVKIIAPNDHQSRLDNVNSDERYVPSRISLDDAGRWGESFDYLMQSKDGQFVFREFLKMEYSEENLLFWLACEDLKREASPDVVEEKARLIYEDYISILSAKEVSLDSRVRELINGKMIEPTAGTFDEAQLQIYTLMHRDSYPRFLNSRAYRDIIERVKS